MNYRHGFHAGNFADVLKHVVLTRILLHLNAKPTPYRIVDSHDRDELRLLSLSARRQALGTPSAAARFAPARHDARES